MCSLKTIIWVYILVCVFLFLPAVCTVREDQTSSVSGVPSPRFVLFVFWKVFICSCVLSVPRQGSRRSSSCLSPRQVGVGVRRDRRECRESVGRDALMPADRGRYPPPAVALPSPPAGCLVPGLPLPQARRSREITPPARLWLKPAGSPLTQARRIAADSSPPDRRWLKPAGSPLTNARRPPLSLAPWILSTTRQECRVYVWLCPQEHFNLPCHVHRDSSGAGGSSCCGHGGHSSRLPPCRRSGSGCWGTLWGPLTPRHAQRKPQLPSQPRRASCSCGLSCPVPVCLAPVGCPVLFVCV